VGATQRRRAESLKAEIQTLDLQITDKEQKRRGLLEQIARYDARIAAVPARESELASLTRDYETLQKVYTDLLSKREQSKVAANLERRQIGEQFIVLDPARLPEKPFSPNRPLFLLIGLVAGLALGGGLAGWLEFRETSLRSEADVSATLALPVLARVPVRPSLDRPRRQIRDIALSLTASTLAWLRYWYGRVQGSSLETRQPQTFPGPAGQPLVVTRDSYVEIPTRAATAANADQQPRGNLVVASDAGDAYSRLAAELHQVSQSRPLTTLMMTSAEPGEGKSLTAANLALALSTSYRKRVLLVDADLRQPSLQVLFGADDAPGLSDCLLAAGHTRVQPLRLSSTLSLLPAGYPEPNPLATLTSSRMKELLSEQAQHFDWVIVDAPPLAVFPDAHLLASLANGVVLVVGAGQTPLAAVESAVKMLGRERVVGVVLNRSSPKPRTYYERQARKVGLIQRCSRFFCRA
jgi:capsular exopolysaccharide synthesis family protein